MDGFMRFDVKELVFMGFSNFFEQNQTGVFIGGMGRMVTIG